jgi:hypothetical protein
MKRSDRLQVKGQTEHVLVWDAGSPFVGSGGFAVPISMFGVWWPLQGRAFGKATTTEGLRAWREEMRFRGISITVWYTQKDNPKMFYNGSPMDPGGVKRLISRDSAEFVLGKILKVHVRYARDIDEPITTAEDCNAIGKIIEHIEGIDAKQTHGKKQKDSRPIPDFRARAAYTAKIKELVATVPSNRKIAAEVVRWAVEKGNKDPAGFGKFRVLGESAMAKEAGLLRSRCRKGSAKRT